MEQPMSDDFFFDPFDPKNYDNPYPSYRVLRDEHPVYKKANENPRVWPHYWMLTRAEDVNAALSDWRTFSSTGGTIIDIDASLLPPTMFHMDPPRHDELRSMLARVLTPKRIAGIETIVRDYAKGLVASFRDRGTFDASTEYSQKIPTITMCTLMDLPRADRDRFLDWNMRTLATDDFTNDDALAAWKEMEQYWTDIVLERKEHPGNDLISEILHARVKGDNLSDAEISGFCSLLHDASQNTTMNMIANSIISLSRFPDERRKLQRDPDLWGTALEELLRFESPVQGLSRNTLRDITLHDVTIPAGDQVLLLYGSANHDERVFEDPERLDLDRKPKVHWTFGHGIHYCLGNAVARLEVRVALQVLIEELGDWEVDLDGVVRNQLVPTRGVAHAPTSFA
jgi:cytochrome P450